MTVPLGFSLDRLLHRATVINIRGDSYRMKARHRAGERVTVTDGTDADGAAQDPGPPSRSRSKPGKSMASIQTREVKA